MQHNFIDRTGKRYGKITVLSFIKAGLPPRYESIWLCVCDCGCHEERRTGSLHKQSRCRTCTETSKTNPKLKKDLVGHRFGKLVVTKRATSLEKGIVLWECLCDCGSITVVRSQMLLRGGTKSCGCYRREVSKNNHRTTHGKTKTSEYNIWANMKSRCYNESDASYFRYGGRGTTVCERWLESFENFYEDMGERPKGLSIERMNNDGPYSPENCKWADSFEQNSNRRGNIMITHNNQTHHLKMWSRILDINYGTLHTRHTRGLTDAALFAPINTTRKRRINI